MGNSRESCHLTEIRGPFHKSSYERFLLYEFVDPVLNYMPNEFVALTNLCETGPRTLAIQPLTIPAIRCNLSEVFEHFQNITTACNPSDFFNRDRWKHIGSHTTRDCFDFGVVRANRRSLQAENLCL